MREFLVENSSDIFAQKTGLAWLTRLSTLTVAKAQSIDWHAHENVEIIVCHKGAAHYEFEGRPPVTVNSGCFMVIPPRVRHRISGGIDSPVARSSIFLRVYRRKTTIRNFFTPGEYREILARLLEKRLCPIRIPFDVERNAKAMPALIRKGAALTLLENCKLRAIVINVVLGAAAADRSPANPSSGDIIKDAMNWIDARLDRPFSLDELIKHIGYGRSRFYSLFKFHTGLSPLEWATNRRLEKAQELLSSGKTSVADVARAVGFRTPAFFAKTFRTHYGVTPGKWAAT